MKSSNSGACCLNCGSKLTTTFSDLGTSPLCEEFVKPEEINKGQMVYPLHVYVCEECLLVQVEEFVSPEEIYADYYYFSSYSDSWLQHAKEYTDFMLEHYPIGKESFVVEIASNDGYLLQYFKEKGISVLGVEPSVNVAKAALEKDIPTEQVFFGEQSARELREKHGKADLLLGNNVLAHVPDINDFIKGIREMLEEDGAATFEFPHLMQLVENNQFDTIYHEHFFYYSLIAVRNIFEKHGLKLIDVQELGTHGGSIRIFVTHKENEKYPVRKSVTYMMETEKQKGYDQIKLYTDFDKNVQETKRKILDLLIDLKRKGKTIAGYGAPGKGNTLLNYCGIRRDFLEYTVDRNPNKHGQYLPGSLIPIYATDKIKETKPDYLFILPWNLKDEIISQTGYIREWGGKFIIPIPEPVIIE
jgi:SAM-dependent methyltransferase